MARIATGPPLLGAPQCRAPARNGPDLRASKPVDQASRPFVRIPNTALGQLSPTKTDRARVGLVVGPHVAIARWGIHAEALELADDRLVLGPAAGQLVGPVDGGLQQIQRHIGAFRLEVRILVPAFVVALDEALVQRPAV